MAGFVLHGAMKMRKPGLAPSEAMAIPMITNLNHHNLGESNLLLTAEWIHPQTFWWPGNIGQAVEEDRFAAANLQAPAAPAPWKSKSLPKRAESVELTIWHFLSKVPDFKMAQLCRSMMAKSTF